MIGKDKYNHETEISYDPAINEYVISMAGKTLSFYSGRKTVQEKLPLTNWMYPVVDTVILPESYNYAPKPDLQLYLPADDIALHLDERLAEWTKLMSK